MKSKRSIDGGQPRAWLIRSGCLLWGAAALVGPGPAALQPGAAPLTGRSVVAASEGRIQHATRPDSIERVAGWSEQAVDPTEDKPDQASRPILSFSLLAPKSVRAAGLHPVAHAGARFTDSTAARGPPSA